MDNRRIGAADIVLGQPLPWNVYDSENRLLLSKGFVVERAEQVQALAERGLFVDSQALAAKAFGKPPQVRETPSVLRFVNQVQRRLESVLLNFSTQPDAVPALLEVVKALTFAVDANRDAALATILLNQSGSYPVRHCVDTAIVCMLMARALGATAQEVEQVMAAALTMNLAMMRLQHELQQKQGRLSEEEARLVRSHPEEGAKLLQEAGVTSPLWLTCVLQHHENEDGSGYPTGKAGKELEELAKVLGFADRYCAGVSTRAYRKSRLPNATLRDILLVHKTAIAPELAQLFIRELGVYPTGTLVRLQDGEIGVVTGKGETSTTPIVHALVGPRGAPLSFPIKRNTALKLHTVREVLSEEQAGVRFTMQQLWGDYARP